MPGAQAELDRAGQKLTAVGLQSKALAPGTPDAGDIRQARHGSAPHTRPRRNATTGLRTLGPAALGRLGVSAPSLYGSGAPAGFGPSYKNTPTRTEAVARAFFAATSTLASRPSMMA